MSDLPVNVDEGDVDVVPDELDDVLDVDPDPGTGFSPDVDEREVAGLSEMELFRRVLKKGSLMFGDGRMLTSCPCKDGAAVCALYPMPHPMTGDTFMVCTGPIVAKDTKYKFFSENEVVYRSESADYSCEYHPRRLNEEPDYHRSVDERRSSGFDDGDGGGWLE